MSDFIKKCFAISGAIITAAFTLLPESIFESIVLFPKWENTINIFINRIILAIGIFLLTVAGVALFRALRTSIVIKGKGFCIKVKYGDLFRFRNGKKIIPFDECFTTQIGLMPSEIKESSLCGQYLKKYPDINVQSLINNANVKPAKTKSKFNSQERYDSGVLLPNGEYLLLAFAKLDKDGCGRMSRNEYLECLSTLWGEIDKYNCQNDVCVPILGSGITRFDGEMISQQELLDIIIETYKVSGHKIKKPAKLIVVCRRQEGFSLNKIGSTL
jgi:hypothetical protein